MIRDFGYVLVGLLFFKMGDVFSITQKRVHLSALGGDDGPVGSLKAKTMPDNVVSGCVRVSLALRTKYVRCDPYRWVLMKR
jgi:hypothetical protein